MTNPQILDIARIPAAARRPTQGGPPLGVLPLVSGVLLVAGVALGAVLGGGPYPSPFGAGADIQAYFRAGSTAATINGVLVLGASIPLAIYAATVSARLKQLGVTAPGATIALAGGIVASMMLALSGLLQWTLGRPAVTGDEALVRAVHDLSFLTGGPAHVVFLGLLVAGLAVPALILGLLPRALAVTGLVIAALSELSILSLVWNDLAVLVPIGRFPALVWLVVAGWLLPHRRPRRAAARPAS